MFFRVLATVDCFFEIVISGGLETLEVLSTAISGFWTAGLRMSPPGGRRESAKSTSCGTIDDREAGGKKRIVELSEENYGSLTCGLVALELQREHVENISLGLSGHLEGG